MDYLTAEGWLTKGERQKLFDLAKQVPEKGIVVNIGVEFGASVHCLRAGNPKASIWGIDIDISKFVGPIDFSYCRLIQGDSGRGAIEEWRTMAKHPIDLLFIDGDHSFDGVTRDLAWLEFVKLNGIVVFHDCYDWLTVPEKKVHQVCPGVNEAVQVWMWGVLTTGWWGIDNAWKELDHVDTMRIFQRIG